MASRDGATTCPGSNVARLPAWRTVATVLVGRDEGMLSPAEVERLRPVDLHANRNSDAEYAFYRLSGRLQRYAEECLFSRERIVAFVPWTEAVAETWHSRLGRALALGGRQTAEGMLLVTDRQLLMLRDDTAPVGGILLAGYTVHATTHERIANAVVAEHSRGRIRLRLNLQAATGGETIFWIFPASMRVALEEIAALLAAFRPRPGDRRLRRPGTIDRPGTRQRGSGELQDLLRAQPGPDGQPRRVRGAAVVDDDDGSRRLLALTQEHLLLVPLAGDGVPIIQPLAAVTSVEVRRSVLEMHVAWTVGGHPTRRIVVPFPAVAAGECLDIFAVARQALTFLAVEASGTDAPPPATDVESDRSSAALRYDAHPSRKRPRCH